MGLGHSQVFCVFIRNIHYPFKKLVIKKMFNNETFENNTSILKIMAIIFKFTKIFSNKSIDFNTVHEKRKKFVEVLYLNNC
jgi:hypothetical protein